MATDLTAPYGGPAPFPAEFGHLLGFAAIEAYGQALDRLSPESCAANLWTTALDCGGRNHVRRSVDGDDCLAMGFTGWKYNRDDGDDVLGYDLDVLSFAISAGKRLAPAWVIGVGFACYNMSAQASGGVWCSAVDLSPRGGFAQRDVGALAVTASVHGGGLHPHVPFEG